MAADPHGCEAFDGMRPRVDGCPENGRVAMMAPSRKLAPQLMAAAIAQLLDEQRAILVTLPDGSCASSSFQTFLLLDRIGWLEEELAMRLPPGPG
jgi:hypothetical protein